QGRSGYRTRVAGQTNSLAYLGTFSRAVNAPTWKPAADAGPGYAYNTDAEKTASDKLDLRNVRFPNPATITHYKDDGSTETYPVNPGDPLLQCRFSLAKLAWLAPDGPKAGISEEAIRDCFGLQWDNAKWRWEYVASATGPVAIKTLAQVAAEATPREPNFFELLKAGILSGSLERDPGTVCNNPATSNSVSIATPDGVMGSNFDVYKKEGNLQILQIGADIIDQADADSYPTAIHLNAFGLTKADDLAMQTVYGIENLPYLTLLFPVIVADPVPPSQGASGVLKFWLQPQVWSLHQVPADTPAASGPAARPTEFRAYAYGNVYGLWKTIYRGPYYSSIANYDDGSGAGSDIAFGSIYFTDDGNPATSPYYNNPRRLTKDLVHDTAPENLYDDSWNFILDAGNPNRFAAFFVGRNDAYDPWAPGDQPPKYILPNPVATFSLQYKGPDGAWHPYNFMARLTQNTANQSYKSIKPGIELDDAHNQQGTIEGYTAMIDGWMPVRIDPRTDRFSVSSAWSGKYGPWDNTTMYPRIGWVCSFDHNMPSAPGFTYIGDVSTREPMASLWSLNDPSAPFTTGANNIAKAYYADPDGVVRYADCYRQNTTTGDGCQSYHGGSTSVGSTSGWSFSGATFVNPASTLANPKTTNTPPGSAQSRRPVILNRPFRSVGELGFAYRDLPFKTLDFWTSKSGDAGLLDLFSVTDQPAVAAGQVNPNNAPVPVLMALIAGGAKSEALGVQISGADLGILVGGTGTSTGIAGDLNANGPYGNRSELATRLGPLVSDPYSAGRIFDTTKNTAAQPWANWANKSYAEMPVRALSGSSNFRTWNLLIDVVAQSGRMVPAAATLDDFVVEGERRYWLHVAIDRYTGKVVDQQLEPVYE
ncbi:MAG: hypothetical protein WC003_16710, partial [Terrimicrobiaceae bacterium]